MFKADFIKIVVLTMLLLTGCSSFIPEAESERITLKYQAGEYLLREDLDRNGAVIPKNTPVKLFVVTGEDWIKIYAYRSEEELLKSKRLLLLYMFETDFPDEKFSEEVVNREMMKLVVSKGSDYKAESKNPKRKRK